MEGFLFWILISYLLDRKVGEGDSEVLSLGLANTDGAGSDSDETTVGDDEPSLDELFSSYYRSPVEPDVESALRRFLTRDCYSCPEGSIPLAIYFFARIAKDRPSLVRVYERQLGSVSGLGAEALLELLRQAGDAETRDILESCLDDSDYAGIRESIECTLQSQIPEFRNALLAPVRTCLDLDLLWAEFLATGNAEAVRKIIGVLDRQDLVRGRLREWLNSASSQGIAKVKLDKLQALGLRFDVKSREIQTTGDLDCWIVLDGVGRDTQSERAKAIRSLLPFELFSDELEHIAIKSAAKWSLASNAARHPLVLETCVQALEDRELPVRLSLLEIQAEAHLANWNASEAERLLGEYVRLNPDNADMARKHADAEQGVVSIPVQTSKPQFWTWWVVHAVALAGVAWLGFSTGFASRFEAIVGLSFWSAIVAGAVGLIVALAGGAIRQVFNGLIERAVVLETDNGPHYLGDVPGPFWFSPWVRFAWLTGVAVISVSGAGLLAAGLTDPGNTAAFALWFGIFMVSRWAISTLVARQFQRVRR